MKSILIKSLFIGTAALLLTACANDDNYNTPYEECVETGITPNVTVAALAARATTTPRLYTVPAGAPSDYIEGYVTSSDERGSFFKVVTLQTKPTDGSAVKGFSIAIDANGLFGKGFVPGRKVLVKLDSLYYANEYNALKVGALFEGATVGRIAEGDYAKNVIVGCTKVDEEELVQHMTITQALRDENINKLIELDSVQFTTASFGYSLYDVTAPTAAGNPQTIGGSTNHNLEDKYGRTIIFRTSSFANFAGDKVKQGILKVRGVLTKYRDSYQFLPRYSEDIKVINETDRLVRTVEPVAPGSGGPLGGTAITYSGNFTENFESYALNNNTYPKYVTDFIGASRYWQVKQYPANTGNKYIEMTSYVGASSPGVVTRSYFIVPVDFTAANSFTFKKEIRYMAGQSFKVYYATAANYTPGGVIDVNTFTNITSSFTGLTYPAAGASENNFTTAGTYSIPAALTGNGFFVLEYSGGGAVTTTIQIDDIVVN